MSIRTLVVLRHAKSAYPPGVADHDRPLSDRGRRDARVAGGWIDARVGSLDHVVVSTATRTRETWGLVEPSVQVPGDVRFEDSVYAASAATLNGVLRSVPPEADTVLLVGHNPGCEDLALSLAGTYDEGAYERLTTKYPTSGIAVLRLFSAWSDLAPGQARLEAFEVPRG